MPFEAFSYFPTSLEIDTDVVLWPMGRMLPIKRSKNEILDSFKILIENKFSLNLKMLSNI